MLNIEILKTYIKVAYPCCVSTSRSRLCRSVQSDVVTPLMTLQVNQSVPQSTSLLASNYLLWSRNSSDRQKSSFGRLLTNASAAHLESRAVGKDRKKILTFLTYNEQRWRDVQRHHEEFGRCRRSILPAQDCRHPRTT